MTTITVPRETWDAVREALEGCRTYEPSIQSAATALETTPRKVREAIAAANAVQPQAQGEANPELCIHALSVNDDMDLLCCKGPKRVMCTGPCADFVDAFKDDEPAANPQATEPQAQMKALELHGIEEAIAEGQGFWAPCTGCFETNEGHPPRGSFFSKVFKCHLGNGCRECGGIGAIWDNTDYDAMAEFMMKEDAHPQATEPAPTTPEPAGDVIAAAPGRRCTYDNRVTMARECWEDGRLVFSVSSEMLWDVKNHSHPMVKRLYDFLPILQRGWRGGMIQGDSMAGPRPPG